MRKHLVKLNFLFLFFLFSCEKIIDIPLNEADSQLVIEGNVDNYSSTQEVIISRSTSFSYGGDPSPVSNAKVYLREENKDAKLLVEEGKGVYRIRNFKGKPGSTYFLSVEVDGEEYKSQSTMPMPVRIDSVGTVSTVLFSETIKSAMVVYTDPKEVENYYRFKLEVNQDFGKIFWLSNDRLTNGKEINRNLLDLNNNLEEDDEVKIYLYSIDSNMYSYWDAILSQNPGSSTPSNPKSNISNNALGYFSAHSIDVATFNVK